MLFPLVGSFCFDVLLPIRAAPVTCMIVVTTSIEMKVQRMNFFFIHHPDPKSVPEFSAHVMRRVRQT
jgi:hypothetical protein